MSTQYGEHAKIPWWQTQIVRIRGYTAATAIIAIAVSRGWIQPTEANLIGVIVACLFGVWGIESTAATTVAKPVVEQKIKQIKRAEPETESGSENNGNNEKAG